MKTYNKMDAINAAEEFLKARYAANPKLEVMLTIYSDGTYQVREEASYCISTAEFEGVGDRKTVARGRGFGLEGAELEENNEAIDIDSIAPILEQIEEVGIELV